MMDDGPGSGQQEIREEPVYCHPEDVLVEAHQQLVEQVEVVLPDGEITHLTVAGEKGEAWNEQAYAFRREAALARVQAEFRAAGLPDHPPAVIGTAYVLRTYGKAPGGASGGSKAPRGMIRRAWDRLRGD